MAVQQAVAAAAQRFHRSVAHPAKRLMDVVGATVLLVLTAPILAVAALGIAVLQGGPVIHRRRVLGLGGRPFDAFKLRSMVTGADAQLARLPELRKAFERNFKLDKDPRITRLGAWLRRWSIDELPQLVNVLRGEMSLVGPRMITADELAKYGSFADQVVTLRPGLTGLWQVSGRQLIDYGARVRLDVEYVQHWSLLRDIKIVCLTPFVVMSAKGAK